MLYYQSDVTAPLARNSPHVLSAVRSAASRRCYPFLLSLRFSPRWRIAVVEQRRKPSRLSNARRAHSYFCAAQGRQTGGTVTTFRGCACSGTGDLCELQQFDFSRDPHGARSHHLFHWRPAPNVVRRSV